MSNLNENHFQETEPGFKDILKCLFVAITALQNAGAIPNGTPSHAAQRAALQIKKNHNCMLAKKLYRNAAKKFHPDKNKNSDQSQIDMALINIANENATCDKSQSSKPTRKSQSSDPNIDSVGVLAGGIALAGTGLYYKSNKKYKKNRPPKLRRQRTEEDAKLRNCKPRKQKLIPPPKIVNPPTVKHKHRRSTTPPRKSRHLYF